MRDKLRFDIKDLYDIGRGSMKCKPIISQQTVWLGPAWGEQYNKIFSLRYAVHSIKKWQSTTTELNSYCFLDWSANLIKYLSKSPTYFLNVGYLFKYFITPFLLSTFHCANVIVEIYVVKSPLQCRLWQNDQDLSLFLKNARSIINQS